MLRSTGVAYKAQGLDEKGTGIVGIGGRLSSASGGSLAHPESGVPVAVGQRVDGVNKIVVLSAKGGVVVKTSVAELVTWWHCSPFHGASPRA